MSVITSGGTTPNHTNYLKEIKDSFQEILKLESGDVNAIDFVLCLSVLNQWSKDLEPVWGYIVGPPGSAKTEILRTLDGWTHAYTVDELTGNALASGYIDEQGNKDDPSLLPKLHQKVLVIKDFTSFSSGEANTILKILSTLRAAYDGTYTKHSGAADTRSYECRFGILAATVPTIDAFMRENQKLGERFVSLRIRRDGSGTIAERTRRLRHVMNMTKNKVQWRANLREVVQTRLTHFLSSCPIKPEDIQISESNHEQLAIIADLISRLRTTPYDGMPAAAESGGRIVQQFYNIVRAKCALEGRLELDSTDIDLVIRVAQDTLPFVLRKIIEILFVAMLRPKRNYVSADELAKFCTGGEEGLHHTLRQYKFLGIIEKASANSYKLSDEAFSQIMASGIFNHHIIEDSPKVIAH